MNVTQKWGFVKHASTVGIMVCKMKRIGMVAIKADSLIKTIGALVLTRISMT